MLASIRQPDWHRRLDKNALCAEVDHRRGGSNSLPRVARQHVQLNYFQVADIHRFFAPARIVMHRL